MHASHASASTNGFAEKTMPILAYPVNYPVNRTAGYPHFLVAHTCSLVSHTNPSHQFSCMGWLMIFFTSEDGRHQRPITQFKAYVDGHQTNLMVLISGIPHFCGGHFILLRQKVHRFCISHDHSLRRGF